ncbi:MAG: hypothetical protein H8E66_12780 [Planctomycetes bacterium]|nr:hypothetical protein [Planctomycetota bacterium]
MTVETILPNKAMLLLVTCLLLLSPRKSHSDEVVSIRLADGRKMTAEVHPRTDDEHLWLRFSGNRTVILRAIAWEQIATATMGEAVVSAEQLRTLGEQHNSADESGSPSEDFYSPRPSQAQQARELLGFSRRINAVDFDARIANWDRDVEFDGIVLRLLPLDADGQLTRARGTLHVELVAARRRDFNDVPRSRGQVPSQLDKWSVSVSGDKVTESGVVVKLPFKTNHPEFDTTWAAHGLVHVRFVVPGHGVFEHSFDGLRVRPFAPLRDEMERNSGQRFLPTERTGVGKRIQQ